MPLVQFKIFDKAEGESLVRQIGIACDFLPRIGDVFNTFDLFDDIKVEGNHYSIVYDIEWTVEGNHAVPVVKLNRYEDKTGDHRLDILRRHNWLPRKDE